MQTSDARSWILHSGTYICVSSVWNLRHAALLAPRILWRYLDIFWDNVGIATTLRAGRSGDRIPVTARLSVSSRLAPRPTQPSAQRVIRSFPGVKLSKHCTDTQLLVVLGCEWVGTIPPSYLSACIDMS